MRADRFVLQVSPKIRFESADRAITLPRILLKRLSNDCVQIAPERPPETIRTDGALLDSCFAAELARCNHVRRPWSIVFSDGLDQIRRGVGSRTRRVLPGQKQVKQYTQRVHIRRGCD